VGLQEILWTLQNLPTSWQNILDILLVTAAFSALLLVVRGTRAATLLRGIGVVLLILWGLSLLLNLQAFGWLLGRTISALAIALPVIFQEELRRWLDRVGRIIPVDTDDPLRNLEQMLIDEISEAARQMSRRKHGALIVIERDSGLQEYIDSGIEVDALVSSALLQTTFFPNTALHDGAAIIRGNRLVAAACTLPLSSAPRLPEAHMGMRHRAALGIAEASDALAIVVSEQTGRITLVEGGHFFRAADADRLAEILRDHLSAGRPVNLVDWWRRVWRN
jgi:diadenylate cyclase